MPMPLSPPEEMSARLEFRRTRARISYFMLFRLAILAAFTVLAGVAFYTSPIIFDPTYVAFVWVTLVISYALTIAWAVWLPRAKDLTTVASIQTASDILLSAVVVQMTGGVDSGFVSLYLISVLGAATMGGPRNTWAAAGACTLIYLVMSVLEILGLAIPFTSDPYTRLSASVHWATTLRTVAGLIGVSVLSSYLNVQLMRSVSQVGNLRALNENIVQSLTSGLITLDRHDQIVYFNPAARTLLDLDDGILGTSIERVLPGIVDWAHIGPSERRELPIVTSRGRRVRIGLTQSSLRDAERQDIGSLIHFQDVTPLHELALRARRNERLAALGGLAASVAHEIRNPLAAISGSAELLATASLGDEDQRLLQVISRESNRLNHLITEVLAFTRPRDPQPSRIDIAIAVAEACEAFRTDPAASERKFALSTTPEVLVDIDAAALSQILWNLLRNAAEATASGGHILVRVTEVAGEALIEIEDSGTGIAPEYLERIFDPFFTTKDAGTGFGLAMVHRAVEDNGGTISVHSQLAVGTTFALRFPLWKPSPRPSDSGCLEPSSDLYD